MNRMLDSTFYIGGHFEGQFSINPIKKKTVSIVESLLLGLFFLLSGIFSLPLILRSSEKAVKGENCRPFAAPDDAEERASN